MKLSKWMRASLLAPLVIVTGVVLAPAATAEGPSCRGNSCEGINPANTNCLDDARTIYRWDAITPTGENLGNLEMRYSPKCHANWARFTRWNGVSSWLGDGTAGAQASGRPWIWRQGVAGSLRGVIDSAGKETPWEMIVGTTTGWTAMVTADGTTCSSVQFIETENHHAGGGERRELGAFNAPCVS